MARGPCKTCNHWKEKEVKLPGQDPRMLGNSKTTVCTRNPPTVNVMLIPGPLGQVQVMIQALDPPTNANHECGEHSPKLKAK